MAPATPTIETTDVQLLEDAVAGDPDAMVSLLHAFRKELATNQKLVRDQQRQLAALQKAHQDRFEALEDSYHDMQDLMDVQLTALGKQRTRLQAQTTVLDDLLEAQDNDALHTPQSSLAPAPNKSPKKRVTAPVATAVAPKRAKMDILPAKQPEEALEYCWDLGRCGALASISDDRRLVKTTANGWNVVMGDGMTKAHNTIALGFTTEPDFWRQPSAATNVFNFCDAGWFLNVRKGTRCSRDGHDDSAFATSLKSGDVLTVVFDRPLRTIRFLRNGNALGSSLGVAYADIAETELYPALVSYDRGVGVQLV
ncbi:hypothetical protein SPRG_06248 [Saprolegnia parasitica CBS 223.65]|uniref:B30.2/SPRY domain-containing protein n=1 Tax=Saprolegnia parasitica (strain CBS 223.65) TaxID=695850 RepID=A0A067CBU4_SAPPC|nr:hypothetical protein SPRG_06248 [Saprolegnia parasitica CBS 223.65]KDO28199.1 hypothetical protein SPRG_06248 [Saprolegnia parasitica CBS 223.65]|eukprot:XP_012201024.1 hypothetical protein SPRG_06248 [Saprolegnia parasitica CBS 223.65]